MGAYIALISAFILVKGTLSDKFDWMLKSIAQNNVFIPVVVLALAGGFSAVTKGIGGVDAIVALCLKYVPTSVVTAGFFVVGSIISLASGSSATTVVAIAPVALTFASSAGISLPLMLGTIMGSAMFGNSCSPVSDCTIVSNSIIGLGTKKGPTDKLISQLTIYAGPYLLTVILLFIFGRSSGTAVGLETAADAINLPAIIPYILILILAFSGINFVLTLSAGIFVGLVIGVAQSTFDLLNGFQTIANGMYGMANMILLFIFMGGTVGIVAAGGGIEWIVAHLTKLIKGRKSAEAVVLILNGLLVFLVGNDTIPMMTLGSVIKDIAHRYKLDARRVAALMPIGTASMAVIVPYTGASLTAASYLETNTFSLSFVEGIPYDWFVLLVLFFTVISIFIPFANKRFEKDPWDYEEWIM